MVTAFRHYCSWQVVRPAKLWGSRVPDAVTDDSNILLICSVRIFIGVIEFVLQLQQDYKFLGGIKDDCLTHLSVFIFTTK